MIEQAWLTITPGDGALRWRPKIFAQLEQHGLRAFGLAPLGKLLAAEFANPPPAIGMPRRG
jgi:hypothetical protein